MPEYTFLIRDPFTLAIVGELRDAEGQWVHRDIEAGQFSLAVNRYTIADPTLLDAPKVIEIRRDGVREFTGLLEADSLGNPSLGRRGETWAIDGPDLKGFLANRAVINGVAYDAVTNAVAETAMRGYVSRHLVAPTDSTRGINSELSGITFDIAADLGRGALVSGNYRGEPLITALAELARAGGLWHEVRFQVDDAGYSYAVRAYRDRTDGSVSPMIFGLSWENVASLAVRRDIGGVANRVSVLATDAAGNEFLRTIQNATSQGQHLIRERAIDGSSESTATIADAEGLAVITESLAGTMTVDAQPFPGTNGEYRVDYELGDDVTVVVPDIGLSIDKRIVEVTVSLDRQSGEQVAVTLGAAPRTAARVIAQALRQTRRRS